MTARTVARTIGTLALAAMTAGCATSRSGVPRPFPIPGAPAAPASPKPAEGAPVTPKPSGGGGPVTPKPSGGGGPVTPKPSGGGGPDGYALAGTALSLRGTPYRNGGSDPSGFDCSGFTQFVFAQYGVALPRAVAEQYRLGKTVTTEDVAPGDLLFFSTTSPDVSHVAVAIGGDEFVHAPSSTGVVRVEHLSASYWTERFLGARRVP